MSECEECRIAWIPEGMEQRVVDHDIPATLRHQAVIATIVYCPLHTAAPQMREILKEFTENYITVSRTERTAKLLDGVWERAKQALAAATPRTP